MHDKLFFSLAILSHPIDPHTLIIDFLSYQASLAYNPKEFLGVITEHRLKVLSLLLPSHTLVHLDLKGSQ
jgi:hypothetical protein